MDTCTETKLLRLRHLLRGFPLNHLCLCLFFVCFYSRLVRETPSRPTSAARLSSETNAIRALLFPSCVSNPNAPRDSGQFRERPTVSRTNQEMTSFPGFGWTHFKAPGKGHWCKARVNGVQVYAASEPGGHRLNAPLKNYSKMKHILLRWGIPVKERKIHTSESSLVGTLSSNSPDTFWGPTNTSNNFRAQHKGLGCSSEDTKERECGLVYSYSYL